MFRPTPVQQHRNSVAIRDGRNLRTLPTVAGWFAIGAFVLIVIGTVRGEPPANALNQSRAREWSSRGDASRASQSSKLANPLGTIAGDVVPGNHSAAATALSSPLTRQPSHGDPSRPDGWSPHWNMGFRTPTHIQKASLQLLEPDEAISIPNALDSESPPASTTPLQIRIPLAGPNGAQGTLSVTNQGDRISLTVRDSQVDAVLGAIAQQFGLNVVTAGAVNGRISVTLADVPLEDALDAILKTNGYVWVRDKNIILVSPMSGELSVAPGVQGREVRVFNLNFVLAADMQTVIQGLLSPAGKSFVTESNATDRRKTHEAIVVEDLPPYLERVAQYIAEADQAPRQVLIEAHILEVDLQDSTEHGVDFAALARVAGSTVVFSTPVFNTPADTLDSVLSPAYSINVVGNDLLALIEAIKRTTDAKTLASPKTLVINGQESRIQVGQRLGYFVTTTTQTSTLQEVQFLETGIVLRVTPTITDDNRVLMTVKPEVSDGSISDLGLPQERTTEVETTVMLHDGYGMVIGGLIKETDIEQQTKIPILGDVWLMGRFFQRRKVERARREIIIGLVPRIVPYTANYQCREQAEMQRATTPILEGPLKRVDRTEFEPQLPDAIRDPRRARLNRFPEFFKWKAPFPKPADFYFPSHSEENPPPAGALSDGLRAAGVQSGPTPDGSYTGTMTIPPSPLDTPSPIPLPTSPPPLPTPTLD